jgi:hypothetical protein
MIVPQTRFYQPSSPDNTYGFRRGCEAVRGAIPIETRICRDNPLRDRTRFVLDSGSYHRA